MKFYLLMWHVLCLFSCLCWAIPYRAVHPSEHIGIEWGNRTQSQRVQSKEHVRGRCLSRWWDCCLNLSLQLGSVLPANAHTVTQHVTAQGAEPKPPHRRPGIPRFWPRPDSKLAVASIWGVNQKMRALSLCVFQINITSSL